jgi:hypothetical protein
MVDEPYRAKPCCQMHSCSLGHGPRRGTTQSAAVSNFSIERATAREAMKDITMRQPTRLDTACQHLAIRVIHRAVRDLSAAGASRTDQESARAFLSGSPMLEQWCEVANLNSSQMVARASRLVARSGRLASGPLLRRHFGESTPPSASTGQREPSRGRSRTKQERCTSSIRQVGG